MPRKVTAITLACVFALAGSAYALPGGNDRPGNSDCHGNGHPAPGENGLCK